jgi:hypothetical protein
VENLIERIEEPSCHFLLDRNPLNLQCDQPFDVGLEGPTTRNVVAAAPETPQVIADSLDLLSVAKNLEGVADHAANIAEDMMMLVSGQIVRPRHMESE